MAEGIEVAHNLFLNRENELRSGWRVLAFALLFLAMLLTLEGLLHSIGALSPRAVELTQEPSPSVPTSEVRVLSVGISRSLMLAVALAASAICARALEHRSFGSIGYRFHPGWKRDFLLGLLLGTASLAFVVLISYLAGAVEFSVLTSEPGLWMKRFLILAFVFLSVAAYEEVLTRGFAFQALHHNLGAAPALLITSTVFGLLHLGNPNATAFSIINIVLAGIWLGAAYLVTRSLWLATGLHLAWNFALTFIFGLPVSGILTFDQITWLDGEMGNPAWLSGGSFGPEGGVAATVALIISTLVVWKGGLFRPSEEMLAATRHGRKEPDRLAIVSDE
jgi:membrane protease YdiL (CAAX protease family)